MANYRMIIPLLLLSLLDIVRPNFIVTVNFINYTNPTGLCAECETRLGVNGVSLVSSLVPVCCDEPVASNRSNCGNTGDERCDTRFRWTLRLFGSSLETRPVTIPGADIPPYLFTDCSLPTSLCPFSEMSTTFGRGELGFLGVAQNPLPVPSRSLSQWTGRVQFFIESVHSGLPNIIDSLLINLDNLQLGADFTEEMTYTGYHNISQMTMSFRVECAPGYCGSDCTLTPLSPQVLECLSNGTITCVDGWDPSTGCTTCTSARRVDSNCSQCVFNTDPSNDCQCLEGFTGDDCSQCVFNNTDPSNHCQCLEGFTGDDCSQNSQANIIGPVVGVVAAILLVVVVLTVIIIVVFVSRHSKASKDNIYSLPDETQGKNDYVNTTPPIALQRILKNPLYDTRATAVGDKYSAPWENSGHYAYVETTSLPSNKERPADEETVDSGYSVPERQLHPERAFDRSNTGESGLYGSND